METYNKKINMAEYLDFSERTENKNFSEISARCQDEGVIRLLHGSMGLVTEAGELLDAMKKHLFYGKPIDMVNIQEEIGDSLFYIAAMCRFLGISFEDAADKNIKKLRSRYPNNFSEYDAENRDLDAERKILEE